MSGCWITSFLWFSLYLLPPLPSISKLSSVRSLLTKWLSATFPKALHPLFPDIFDFILFHFFFLLYSLFSKTLLSNFNSLAAFQQSVLKGMYGTLVEYCSLNCNVIMLLLLKIDGPATKVCLVPLCGPANISHGGLQRPIGDHPQASSEGPKTRLPLAMLASQMRRSHCLTPTRSLPMTTSIQLGCTAETVKKWSQCPVYRRSPAGNR